MLRSDIQKLEAGSLVTLIEVDCTEFGGDILYFHGHNIVHRQDEIDRYINPLYAGSLKWFAGSSIVAVSGAEVKAKGILFNGISYTAWPCEVSGIEFDSAGQSANPTLSVANLDSTISSMCLYFDDLLQAKVTIRQTLAKYLDSGNFTTVNPDADPTQQVTETWYIDAKTQEDNESVSWRLSSPADLSGQIIPARIITGVCEWALRGRYRGPECGYTGSARFDLNDQPTTNPEQDKCAGMLPSCKCRFGDNNPLPFGGFPAASLLGK